MNSETQIVLVVLLWVLGAGIGIWIQYEIIRAAVLSALNRHRALIDSWKAEAAAAIEDDQ